MKPMQPPRREETDREQRAYLERAFQTCLGRLALKAGRKVLGEVIDELFASREPDFGPFEFLEVAVAMVTMLNRSITQRRMDWFRLRKEAVTAQDPGEAARIRREWWLEHTFASTKEATLRLARQHGPELEACRELHLRLLHRLDQKYEYLCAFIGASESLGRLNPSEVDHLAVQFWGGVTRPSRWTVRVAALNGLTSLFRLHPKTSLALRRDLQLVFNNPDQFYAVRAAAFRLFLLLDEDTALRQADHVLGLLEQRPDEFLFRRAVLALLGELRGKCPTSIPRAAQEDPNSAVRQMAVQVLLQGEETQEEALLERFARDPSFPVRGCWLFLLNDPKAVTRVNALRLGSLHLRAERSSELLASSLRCLAERLSDWAAEELSEHVGAELLDLASVLPGLLLEEGRISLHSWVWLCTDLCRILLDPGLRSAFLRLREQVRTTSPGSKLLLPSQSEVSREALQPILSSVAALDLGLFGREQPGKGLVLRRGARRNYRLWRWLHELRHPAHDKRQAHSHLTGICLEGDHWYPSLVMSEVTRTRVPGESVYLPVFASGAPHLPGPTQADNLAGRDVVRLFLPGSDLELSWQHPRRRRWRDRLRLVWRFADLDVRRYGAVRQGNAAEIEQYLSDYEEVTGQQVVLRSTDGLWERPRRSGVPIRLAAIPGLDLLRTLEDLGVDFNYFLTPYANRLWHLAVFLGLASGTFAALAVQRRRRITHWRRSMPLCIGGWGSRGKSGSERLKAGLFTGLGYQVFSKTTGSEAMFISSFPGIDQVEVPIFRPYDKATIFEQLRVLEQASAMDTQVFLWECMALNPRYVQILAHDWMKDDLATVTNTYPDHEDIQGPTGYDVATTISLFIPRKSKLITAEGQSYPLLAEAGRFKGTEVLTVPEVYARLIPEEYLGRFPYLENALNIAMCLGLADELDIPRDLALVVMADNLLGDVGALRRFAPLVLAGRRIVFGNTMAANERAGFLASLRGLQLDRWKREDNLAQPLVLMINNRADRPARSHVFAKTVVEDVFPSAVLVVGSAVREFRDLVEYYFGQYLALRPRPLSTEPEQRRHWLTQLLAKVRVEVERGCDWRPALTAWLGSTVEETDRLFAPLAERCAALVVPLLREDQPRLVSEAVAGLVSEVKPLLEKLGGTWENEADLEVAANVCVEELAWNELARHLLDLTESDGFETTCPSLVAMVRATFLQRVVVVPDFDVSAEGLVEVILGSVPPKSSVQVVGAQNIKGPGLRFVEFWTEHEQVVQRLEQFSGQDVFLQEQAFEWLLQRKHFSRFDAELVVAELTQRGGEGGRGLGIEELALLERLQAQVATKETTGVARVEQPTLTRRTWWKTVLNAWFDTFDSVRRRKEADLTYKLLAAELISHAEAVRRLDRLNLRQREGWLYGRE